MRVLILGGDGMLGHQLLRHLGRKHDARVTLRKPLDAYAGLGLFRADNAFGEIDVRAGNLLAKLLDDFRPAVVVNAVGIIKQRPVAHENIENIEKYRKNE